MRRAIVGFRQDSAGDWVASLACGHPQHVRHRPPMEERPWVLTAQGRESKIGEELACHYCGMPSLPEGAHVYKTSPTYTEVTVPDGLLTDHRLRAGTWARIVVEEGKLLYALSDDTHAGWMLRPGIDGIVAPTVSHFVLPSGKLRFHIEFLHAPQDDEDGGDAPAV